MLTLAQRISQKIEDRRLKINVGGMSFETRRSTLRKRPASRLAMLAERLERDESWDNDKQEFFFDRHPGVFASILHCYRTDELHTDHNLCGNIIKTEFDYWGLTELDIEPCCWGHYCKFKENKKTLTALDDNFTFPIDDDGVNNPPSAFTKFKRNMWISLEEPSSSYAAKAYAIISMFFVLLSIGVFVLETHHIFRVQHDGYNTTAISRSVIGTYMGPSFCSCKIENYDLNFNDHSDPHYFMTYLDYLCATFFTLEYLVRVCFAPSKLEFFKRVLNIIDFLCLVPHFSSIIIQTATESHSASNILRSLLALRVIRVLRIFKLMKHYTAFQILIYTIKVSAKELLLMVVFLFSGVLIFASVIYYVEPLTFNNIPVGFWWAIVTMTTVGYGDKVPVSEGGYIIGFMCVICGVLTVAFTVPIVVNNFTLYYAHAQSRNQLPPSKKRELQQKLILKNQRATEFIKKLAINVQTRRQNAQKDNLNDNNSHGHIGENNCRVRNGKISGNCTNFSKLDDVKSRAVNSSESSKDSGIDTCMTRSPTKRSPRRKIHLASTDCSAMDGINQTLCETVYEGIPEPLLPGTPDPVIASKKSKIVSAC